jgi:serine/threonine-protein kinase RsbW
MATVEMTFTPLPTHVRTARLVATAVARRSGVAEAFLDEVRLAVGEACSRAVEVHQEHCPEEPVRVALTGSSGRFEVVVTNSAAHDDAGWHVAGSGAVPGHDGNGVGSSAGGKVSAGGDAPAGGNAPAGTGPTSGAGPVGTHGTGSDAEAGFPLDLPQELGLAVIAGLADDVEVSRTEGGLSIRMSWPSGETAG